MKGIIALIFIGVIIIFAIVYIIYLAYQNYKIEEWLNRDNEYFFKNH